MSKVGVFVYARASRCRKRLIEFNSALTLLHSECLQRSVMGPTYRGYAIAALKQNSEKLIVYLREILSERTDCVNVIPHLSLHWIYQAAIIQARYNRDTDSGDSASFRFLSSALKTLKRRWIAAGITIQAVPSIFPSLANPSLRRIFADFGSEGSHEFLLNSSQLRYPRRSFHLVRTMTLPQNCVLLI